MTDKNSKYFQMPIGFGGAAISGEGKGYGFGPISESDSIDLLLAAFDLGIKVYDTAPIYGFGLSEERIGKAFKKNREEVFIISKSGVSWHPSLRVDMTNDPKVTLLMLENSLRRLNTDYIDLFMIHWPDERVDIRRPMEVLAKALEQGKINSIGLCNSNLDEISKASEIENISFLQSELNIFNRNEIEKLNPFLSKGTSRFLSWGTLDKGIITGRATEKRNYESEDARSWAPWWKKAPKDKKFKVMEALLPYLESGGHTGLNLALTHNMNLKDHTLSLCGPRNRNQLNQIVNSLQNPLNEDELQYCLEILKKEGF